MLKTTICLIFLSAASKGLASPVLNRQCRSGICDDRPECPMTSCRCVFPSKADCATYYQCVQGKPYQYRCSDGLLFNEDTLSCDYEYKVNCSKGAITYSTTLVSESEITSSATRTMTFASSNEDNIASSQQTMSSHLTTIKQPTNGDDTDTTSQVPKTMTPQPTNTNPETSQPTTIKQPTGGDDTDTTSEEPKTTSQPTTTNPETSQPTTIKEPTNVDDTDTTSQVPKTITPQPTNTNPETSQPTTIKQPTSGGETDTTSQVPKITSIQSTTTKEPTIDDAETSHSSETMPSQSTVEKSTAANTDASQTPEITKSVTGIENTSTTYADVSHPLQTEITSSESIGYISSTNTFSSVEISLSSSEPGGTGTPAQVVTTGTPVNDQTTQSDYITSDLTASQNTSDSTGETSISGITLTSETLSSSSENLINVTSSSTEFSTATNAETPNDLVSFECPTRFGLFPDTMNCSNFYQCSHWIPYRKICPSGLHYNPLFQVCDWPEAAGCGEVATTDIPETTESQQNSSVLPPPTTINPKITTPEQNNGTYCNCDSCDLPIIGDCTSYILCFDRSPILITCDTGLSYNPMTGTCDLQENVQCEAGVQCPESSGHFPYPHSCAHYMECTDKVIAVKKCPEGMVYDKDTNECSWEGSCEDREASTVSVPVTQPVTLTEISSEAYSTASESAIQSTTQPETIVSSTSSLKTTITDATPDRDGGTTIDFASSEKEISHSDSSDYPETTTDGEASTHLPDTTIISTMASSTVSKIIPDETTTKFSISTISETNSTEMSSVVTTLKPLSTETSSDSSEKNKLSTAAITEIEYTTTTTPDTSSVRNRDRSPEETLPTSVLTTNSTETTTSKIDTVSEIHQSTIITSEISVEVGTSSVAPSNTAKDTVGTLQTSSLITNSTETTTTKIDTVSDNNQSTEGPTEISVEFSTSSESPDNTEKSSEETLSNSSLITSATETVPTKMDTVSETVLVTTEISPEISTLSSSGTKENTTDILIVTFHCPSRFGLFPDPDSCFKFYQCSQWTPYHKNCPSSLHFNRELEVCDYPYRSGCDNRTSRDTTASPSFQETIGTNDLSTINGTNVPENLSTTEQYVSTQVFVKTNATEVSLPETATSEIPSSDFTCTSRFGLFADPESCSRFYQCSHWIPHLIRCPSNLHFNPVLQVCDWPYRAGCGDSLVVPTQSGVDDDVVGNMTCNCDCCFLPVTNACSKYLLCLGGVPHIRTCASGLLFSTISSNCDLAERVKSCPTEPNPTISFETSVCIEDDGFYPAKDDCSSFYQCTEGHPYKVRCPPGLHFNVEYEVCESPCFAQCDPLIDCSSKSKGRTRFNAAASRNCPKPNGLFPKIQDCSRFYFCSHGNEVLLQCPPRLHFSSASGSCEEPCTARCDETLVCKHKDPAKVVQALIISRKTGHCKINNGFYPNPVECSSFYQCSNGEARVVNCPNGLHFNPIALECQTKCVAGCDPTISCPTEVPDSKGNCTCIECFLPDPLDCSAYFFCSNHRKTKGYCPYGTLFDKLVGECRNESVVTCETTGDPAMCPESYGIFPYPGDCKKFVHCEDYVAHIRECKDGLEFDLASRSCARLKGNCASTSLDRHCMQSTGVFPHSKNFSMFYQCENGFAYLKMCSPPLLFNSIDGVCDWPGNVHCEHNLQKSAADFTILRSRNNAATRNESILQASGILPSISDNFLKATSCHSVPGVTCPCACRVPTYDECSSFYHCQQDGTACKKYCPEGLYFNKRSMVCDLPSNVECRDFFFAALNKKLSSKRNIVEDQ